MTASVLLLMSWFLGYLQVQTKPGEPREVLLRIYGQILYENPETVVTDSVVYGLLAEKKMGPKLHGIFTGKCCSVVIP